MSQHGRTECGSVRRGEGHAPRAPAVCFDADCVDAVDVDLFAVDRHCRRALSWRSALPLSCAPRFPALAACDISAPASGQAVTCGTGVPNPDPTPVAAAPGSVNVTVTVQPGATLDVATGSAIVVRDQSTAVEPRHLARDGRCARGHRRVRDRRGAGHADQPRPDPDGRHVGRGHDQHGARRDHAQRHQRHDPDERPQFLRDARFRKPRRRNADQQRVPFDHRRPVIRHRRAHEQRHRRQQRHDHDDGTASATAFSRTALYRRRQWQQRAGRLQRPSTKAWRGRTRMA